MDKAEDSRKCILRLQVHCAAQCPGPSNVKGAAPCKSNGVAWPKAPQSKGRLWVCSQASSGKLRAEPGDKSTLLGQQFASGRVSDAAQRACSSPGQCVICFSAATERLISLQYYWFSESSQPKEKTSWKAWCLAAAYQREDGAQVVTLVIARGILPL